jgi:hypothetical protein
MALRAHLLHPRLRGRVVRALVGDRVGKIVGEPFRRIMRHAKSVDTAHVTRGASRHEHIARGQVLGLDIEIQEVFLGLEHDAVLGFFIYLNL